MAAGGEITESSVLELSDYTEIAKTALDGLVLYDNGPVWAILGNANDQELQTKVQDVKGEGRDILQPVGCTVPFDNVKALLAYDTTWIDNKRLEAFLKDPEQKTRYLGGIAFLRGRANLDVKYSLGIPDSVIPEPTEKIPQPSYQNWSPIGNGRTTEVTERMIRAGGFSAMTSANISGTPEIIHSEVALAFAVAVRRRSQEQNVELNLPISYAMPEAEKPLRPRASYPTFEVNTDRLTIIRTGCISEAILRQLVAPLEIPIAIEPKPSPHPGNELKLEHLPSRARDKQGEELRKYLLEAMKVA